MLAVLRTRFIRGQAVFALVALGLLLVSAVLRHREAQRLVTVAPGSAITSGCEEESMFAIWRQAHGEPVYLDPSAPPYAAAYFNWLFYRSYGAVATLARSDTAPGLFIKYGRMFTLCGAVIGAAALSLLAWRMQAGQPSAARLGALALVAFALFGPLTGWWIVTLRPDVWALACECVGLTVILLATQQSHTRRLGFAVVAAVCFYAAWAFKQNYLQGAGVALLFLLWQRQWSSAAILIGGLVIGVMATVLSQGPDYVIGISETALSSRYSLSLGLANFQGMLVRSLPLFLLAGLLPWLAATPGESPLLRPTMRLATLGLILSLAATFLASCKGGAASNYYFTTTIFILLLALAAVARSGGHIITCGAYLLAIALSAYVLIGGRLQLDTGADSLARRWAVWAHAPSPRYADDQCLNLPWLNPEAPTYFTAFHYQSERIRGLPFKFDGIGGLIRQGYFAALFLPAEATTSFDGGSLAGYDRGPTVDGMTLWLRKPSPGTEVGKSIP